MSLCKLDSILEKIQKYHPKYIDLKLDRMLRILNDLDNPHLSLPPTIHVAGTNGKGSTISFLRGMLENNGLSIHTYTSPHLVNFNERIRLNGKLISEEFLTEILIRVDKINNGKEITFFEITTAAAFLAFSSIKADILLLEVGLGGRLDATNVVPNVIASIITEISFDHEHFLGNSLSSIAREKSGIIKSGVPVITINHNEEINEEIKKISRNNNAPLSVIDKKTFLTEKNGYSFILHNNRIKLPKPSLLGDHQLENSALAVACIVLISKKIDKIELSSCFEGLKHCAWPARLQIIKEGKFVNIVNNQRRLIILDGAHNLSGAIALRSTLSKINCEWLIIFGYLKTRDPMEYLKIMMPISKNIITTNITESVESFSSNELLKFSNSLGFSSDKSKDLVEAFKISKTKNLNICVCGSLYLAGEFLRLNKTTPS
ncbi:MAG: bifunctional folylpolyglutamate synthase/dihydrofolate synthase [SAR116 cluster bacterium]|nr:bifunctional folylpolyglutamate synthase/dihydrofolate synthase [SAR116 cluster bacterium]